MNIINAEVRKAVGLSVGDMHDPSFHGCFAIYVLHSSESGLFSKVVVNEEFERAHVIEKEICVGKGDRIESFKGANNAIGTLFLNADSVGTMHQILCNINRYIKVLVY